MAGKKRSGLANDRRAYGCSRHCPIAQGTQVVSTTYTVTYSGNTNDTGTAPNESSSPYVAGSIVTIIGNTGALGKSGYAFDDWNTQPDGSGTAYITGSTFIINGNIILYAVWLPL